MALVSDGTATGIPRPTGGSRQRSRPFSRRYVARDTRKEIIAEWLAQSTWRHRKTRSRHEGRADDRTLVLENLGGKVVYGAEPAGYHMGRRRQVSWRVYSQTVSFFVLMKRWREKSLLDRDLFRRLDRIPYDMADEKNPFPQVVFIEPC